MVIRESRSLWKYAKFHIHVSIELFKKIFHSFYQTLMGPFTLKRLNITVFDVAATEHLYVCPLGFQQIQREERGKRKVAMSGLVVGDKSLQSGEIGWKT